MLTLFDPLEDYLSEFYQQKNNFDLQYYASDILELLGLVEKEEMLSAISRAVKICSTLNIPIDNHFRTVYRFNGKYLIADWKLSPLACYLITINASPTNLKVAKAQLFFNKTFLNKSSRPQLIF